MDSRQETYLRLSSRLALLDDRSLRSLLATTRPTRGWGKNRVISVDGTTVFTKCIPITDREYKSPYSTRNLYGLPCFYNYGVGSAGFGAFREIATHRKTTDWVLSGAIESFPLTYHCRILPVTDPPNTMDPVRLETYVRYWNGSKSIKHYIVDRQAAKHEAVIFLEHIPHLLDSWLGHNMDKLESLISGMQKTIRFLQQNNLLHFDVHSENILTDGRGFFLTDFGLVLDLEFELTTEEQEFFGRHRHYDYGEFFWLLLEPLRAASSKLDPETTHGLSKRYGNADPVTLLQNAEEISANEEITLDRSYLDVLLRYRDIIIMMERFFSDMHKNDKKDTPYVDSDLHRLLRNVPGF